MVESLATGHKSASVFWNSAAGFGKEREVTYSLLFRELMYQLISSCYS